ncbi:MAG: hypothetical protein QW796_07595, partial [Thermoproteota archaeon]
SRASTRIPTLKGGAAMTLEASREGGSIRVKAGGSSKKWRLLLRGVRSVHSVEGGVAEEDTLGTLITPAENAQRLTIRL